MKNQPFCLKTFFILLCTVPFIGTISAQSYNREQYSATKTITIYSSEFLKNRTLVSQFITKKKYEVLNEQLNSGSYELNFTADKSEIASLDSLFATLGYITSSSQNNNNLKYTVKNLKNQIEDNQIQIDRIRVKGAKDSTFQQKNNTESQINYYLDKIKEHNRTLNNIQENENRIYVDFDLRDEQSVPTGNSRITWAKMPGDG